MKISRLAKGLASYLVDTTAVNVSLNPYFAAIETTFYGMSDDVSLNSRMFASTLTYMGLGKIIAEGRDLSKNFFGITEESSEKSKKVHDSLYMAAFTSVFTPILYTSSGETDFKKVGLATLMNVLSSPMPGIIMGYSVDVFRDLTGLKESERVPDLVRRQRSSVKKGLVALLVATSVATLAGIYALTPSEFSDTPNSQKSEQNIVHER